MSTPHAWSTEKPLDLEELQKLLEELRKLGIKPRGYSIRTPYQTPLLLGIYHLDERDIRVTDWADERVTKVRWRCPGGLASYDGAELTRLLVLATDAGLRLAIQPRSMWTVDVQFTRRDVNSPSKMDGLPSLEAMVTSIRFQLGEPIGLGARLGSTPERGSK